VAITADGFDKTVSLPPGLTTAHIRNAVDFVEEKAEELIDLYFEQANVFSAVIGILGVRALDSLSPYKRHKHPDVAQQRFPDLSLRGRLDPPQRNRKGVRAPGLFNRTTIIRAGTSFGVMPSIPPGK